MARLAFIVLAAVLALSACAPAQPTGGVARLSAADAAPIRLRHLDAVNAARAQDGLPALQLSAELNAAADTHARDMSVHHAQAVEMAEIVRDKTQSEEVRLMAADMALTQQGQIGRMQGWLDTWNLPATGAEPALTWMGHPTEGRMPGMA